MSIDTTLAQAEARERERQLRVHKTECAVCGAKGARGRRRRVCRVGTALAGAAATARARARDEAALDRQPTPGQLTLDGAEWR